MLASRIMLCMNIAIHKENHEAYKERNMIISNQHKLFKEIDKKKDGTPPPMLKKESPHLGVRRP